MPGNLTKAIPRLPICLRLALPEPGIFLYIDDRVFLLDHRE